MAMSPGTYARARRFPAQEHAMHPRQLALAAMMILGYGGGATAYPAMPSLSVMAHFPQSGAHCVRWRYHRRREFWQMIERYDEGANRAGTSGLGGADRLPAPETAQPPSRQRRRGWVDPPPLN